MNIKTFNLGVMTHVMNSVSGHENLKKCSKIKSFSPTTVNSNVNNNNNNNTTTRNLNVYNSLRRSINKNVSASKLLASEAIRQSEVATRTSRIDLVKKKCCIC